MNSTTLVSIIIPVYNAEKYLNACIDSCLFQTFDDFEIIAVNDGSKDNSLKILQEYKSNDSRVKVFDKPNEGAAATRRFGIEKASGKYFFFMDSDDTITVDAIYVLQKKIIETNADIVIGNLIVVLESGKVIEDTKNSFIYDNSKYNSYLNSVFCKSILPSMCCRLYKSDLFDGIDFPIDNPIGEDVITNLMIIKKYNPSVELVDEFIYNYIQHPGSAINVNTRVTAIKRMSYINWVYEYYNSLESNERNISKNYFDKFIIEEYFSYLRDNGDPKAYKNINDYVNNVGLNNTFAVSKLKLWHVVMLKCYKLNYKLGDIFRYFFVKLRSILR